MYSAESQISSVSHVNFLGHIKRFFYRFETTKADFLWAHQVMCAHAFIGTIHRVRFAIRSLAHFPASAVWFRFLKSGVLADMAARDPGLIEAIQRPFYDCNYTAKDRAEMLKQHFELSHSIFGAHQFDALMAGHRICLTELLGKNQQAIGVNLFREDAYKREGGASVELTLNGESLLCVTFSFAKSGDDIVMKVGGIQSRGPDRQAQLKEVTQALHGIQPRLLLVESLRAIANETNCRVIECISKENHIYQAWRYRNKKSVKAEYNELWKLAGGIQNSKGNFDVPVMVTEKSIEERPSNKRSEYRRRAALTGLMREQIRDVIWPGSASRHGIAA